MTGVVARRSTATLALLASLSAVPSANARTIYLNFSDGHDAVVLAEQDDAQQNHSRLCEANPYHPWLGAVGCGSPDTCRGEIVALVEEQWQDFDVQFTLSRPSHDYEMVMIGPTSGSCEFGVQGIADIDCGDRVGGNMAFAFDCEGSTAVCAGVISHELGHIFGLAHTSDPSDIMNSGIYEGKQIAFQDQFLPVVAPGCGTVTQNSHLQLQTVLGSAPAGSHPRWRVSRDLQPAGSGCQLSMTPIAPSASLMSLLGLVALFATRRARRSQRRHSALQHHALVWHGWIQVWRRWERPREAQKLV